MDLAKLHRALGGDLVGNTLRAPGPGRPPHDRSLSFKQTRRGLITRAPWRAVIALILAIIDPLAVLLVLAAVSRRRA
jgi:hypothetical protein